MNISDSERRMLGEDILVEDELKTRLYPFAKRAIVNLDDGNPEHVRAHLVQPTVMMVAAASSFTSTLDRPRGAALLRTLADLLEHQQLGEIPWGPKNTAHKPIFRALIDKELGPKIDYEDGSDGMLSLMIQLKAEFDEAVGKLVDRFAERAEGAQEEVVFGFLVQALLRRYAEIEEPDLAWSTVRHSAVDQGWIEPEGGDI